MLRHLKQLTAETALLQKTYFSNNDFHRSPKLWLGQVVGSVAASQKPGVLILLHKILVYELISTECDDVGHIVSIPLCFSSH